MKPIRVVGICALAACISQTAWGESEAAYEEAFQKRAAFYMKQVAAEGPMKSADWAKDAPGVGDPHKYVMPVILAALSANPKDEEALRAYRWLMTVDEKKPDRGLYHFAAYPRTRMYFQFKEQLPADIKDAMLYDVTHYYFQLRAGGTENHQWMHKATGYLWAEALPEVGKEEVPPKGEEPAKTNLAWQRDWLTREVKRYYTAGQGEYDSSTYVAFSVASMSNVFDFSSDAAMRDLARAQMEWCSAAQALKYFHGMNMGPEARGFAKAASDITISDTMNWLYYGDNAAEPMAAGSKVKLAKHASPVLALSKFRPHRVIRNIATKNVALPFEARNSKPDYFGPRGNKDQEYLYVDREYAMTTLYSPEDGVAIKGTILPQTTMFKLSVRDKGDVLTFGVSNGYHGHFPLEGRTPFDQYHQKGAGMIHVCYVDQDAMGKRNADQLARAIESGGRPAADSGRVPTPDEMARVKERSIFGVPLSAGEGVKRDGWFFWQVNKTYVAARPLNGKAEWGKLEKEEKKPTHQWLISPGVLTGWAVQAGGSEKYRDLKAFQDAVVATCKVDTGEFDAARTAALTTLAGDVIKIRHTGGPGGRPEAWTNGEAVSYKDWPVYDGPYMKQKAGSGVLELSDGRETLTIDMSGERAVFKEGKAR